MKSALLALVLSLAFSVPAHAVEYDHVVNERASYSRVIHLYGDSVSRGYALGMFPEQVPPSHPLYGLRSVASTIDLLFAENGIPDAATFAHDVYYGDPQAPDLEHIEEAWLSGTLRVGDVVVFEDAGPAPSDPDEYEAAWWALRAIATERHPVTLLMLEMFDYPPAPEDSQYGLPLVGATGVVRSRGQAFRTAALEPMPYVGQTLLVPLRAQMDSARTSAQLIDGVNIINPDGIHPNVWGQLLMTGEILKAAGYRPYLQSLESVKAIVRDNWQMLGGGAQGFTQQRAEQYVDWLLRR